HAAYALRWGRAVSLNGAGAVAAARAVLVDRLVTALAHPETDMTIVVVATLALEGLLPVSLPQPLPWLRVVATSEAAAAEVRAVQAPLLQALIEGEQPRRVHAVTVFAPVPEPRIGADELAEVLRSRSPYHSVEALFLGGTGPGVSVEVDEEGWAVPVAGADPSTAGQIRLASAEEAATQLALAALQCQEAAATAPQRGVGTPHLAWMFARHPEIAWGGPGAVAAARSCLSDVLAEGGPTPQVHPAPPTEHTVVVLASDGVEGIVAPEAADDPGLVVVHDERALVAEVQARHSRAVQDHHASGGERARLHLVLVFSPPLAPALRRELTGVGADGPGNYLFQLVQVVVVGDESDLGWTARIAADGTVACDWYPEIDGQTVRLDPPARSTAPPPPDSASSTSGAQPRGDDRLIEVRLLGPLQVTARGREVAGWRARARELLALLAAHPEGLTLDQATEALFPGSDAERARANFRTVTSNLRTTLRNAAGLPESAEIVSRVNGRYRLDEELVGVDLWRFNAAGPDDSDVGALTAPIAAGEDFSWAEPIRLRVQRQLVERFGALATRRLAEGDADGAIRAAQRVIEADPDDEDGYLRLMELQAGLGRANGVRTTYRMLERRMADLGVEPSEAARSFVAEQ
ncbi:MAG: hypothetical protein QOK43_1858, partial [Acidimicrobiaceae bacterium]|nr:hypothetical protein [Acidimicrobiaceae bacterium]